MGPERGHRHLMSGVYHPSHSQASLASSVPEFVSFPVSTPQCLFTWLLCNVGSIATNLLAVESA